MRGGPRPPQGGKKGEPQGKGAQQGDAQRGPEHDKGPQGKGGAPEHQGPSGQLEGKEHGQGHDK